MEGNPNQNPFRPDAPSTPPLEYKPPRVDAQDRTKEIYVTTDVYTYLEDTGRKELCRDMFHCDKWKVEPVLLEELEHEQDQKKQDKLRGLIRAVSSFPPKHEPIEESLQHVGLDIRLHDEEWDEIEESLYSNEFGDSIRHIIPLIEERYNSRLARWETLEEGAAKEILHKEIEALRPIRDRLYMRLVHPEFARKITFTSTINRPATAA